jgi:hypothetical protein
MYAVEWFCPVINGVLFLLLPGSCQSFTDQDHPGIVTAFSFPIGLFYEVWGGAPMKMLRAIGPNSLRRDAGQCA